jgi:chemotaxis protein MotD
VAHVAAILPKLQSASALPSASSPAFGDDFAAVLAGLAPSTHVAKEAPQPQQTQPANGKVVQAAPAQTQPKPRTRLVPTLARADSKPDEKAKAQTANVPAARAAETPKAAAVDSDEENIATVVPVAAARPTVAAQPKIELAVKSVSPEAPKAPPDAEVAPLDSGADAADPVRAQTAAANAKPISLQALAEIVAAAKGTEQTTAPVPENLLKAPASATRQAASAAPENLLKIPAGAQIDVAGEIPAKPGVKDMNTAPQRTSVTMRSIATAPLPVVADKTARALSDIAANESQASELSDKTGPAQAGDAQQQQDAPPDRRDAPETNVAAPAAKADAAPQQQPAQPQQAGNQIAPVTPPVSAAAPAAPANAVLQASVAPQRDMEELTNVTDLGAVIAAKSAAGVKSFEIRLDPAELGRVEVKLTLGVDGKADATIVAHRPETLALLLRDSQNLERTLKESGLDVSNSSLNFSLKGEGRQGDGGGASKAHTRNLSNAVVARSEATNASIASLSLAPSSARLDIRV